jgi:hypothetical protein
LWSDITAESGSKRAPALAQRSRSLFLDDGTKANASQPLSTAIAFHRALV